MAPRRHAKNRFNAILQPGSTKRSRAMRQFLDCVPVIFFFTAYQLDGLLVTIGSWEYIFDGLFSATQALMISSFMVWAISYSISRKNDARLMWMTVAILAFGTATLLLIEQRFIQWKSTIFNWALAAIFFVSEWMGREAILENIIAEKLMLPQNTWLQLNIVWAGNFLLVGGLNSLVVDQFHESTWASYKVYSSIGFSILLMLLSIKIVAPHITEESMSNET